MKTKGAKSSKPGLKRVEIDRRPDTSTVKKKRVDGEKPKKQSTALVPVEQPRKKKKKLSPEALERIEKKRKLAKLADKVDEVRSLFGKDSDEIQELIHAKDSDRAILTFQRSMLASLVDLIPLAEEEYRKYKNERAAYAMNALISQAREIIADMQATRDQQQVADNLSINILQPSYIQIAQFILDQFWQLKKQLADHLKEGHSRDANSKVDDVTKVIGQYMNEMYRQTSERIIKTLVD